MKEPINRQRVTKAIKSKLTSLGLEEANAAVVAQHLVDAEVLGMPSHGFNRLGAISATLNDGSHNGPGHFQQVAPSVHMYNAEGELGIVALQKAVSRAAQVANKTHVCIMAATGYVGTTGVLGSYTGTLADEGLVGLAFCGSEYAVAPYGGARAVLGTNPIAVAFPTRPTQFSADLATAAWSYGELKLAMNENRQIPSGIVQDIDGQESTDPNDADEGSQLPMAGHKGYALGLAIELLCGPLIGGKAGRNAVPGGDGALIIALRGDSFRPSDDVNRDAHRLYDEIKATPLAPNAKEIRIPGERHRHTLDSATEVMVDVEALAKLGITIG